MRHSARRDVVGSVSYVTRFSNLRNQLTVSFYLVSPFTPNRIAWLTVSFAR